MKKVRKTSRVNDLMVDVLEYAFTEWLIRRGVYFLFKANFIVSHSPVRNFRRCFRGYVWRCANNPHYDPSCLVSAAFVFFSTPEGADFWLRESAAWEHFYSKFQTKR